MPGESVEAPARAASATRLPRPASSFVGREAEMREVIDLVRGGNRFVTLTGSGGSGKTRLAIEAAAELQPHFLGAVHWLSLAVLTEPRLVLPTLADALAGSEDLAGAIGEARMLVVLDNFEQVVSAAPELSALLEACPNLFVLVTSRELLAVVGEVPYAVAPLPTDDAVTLFCRRSGLAPDDAIAELCRRLDNLPLALELAAARSRVLSPAQILARLSQRLDLFRGSRDAEPRQRTLRAAIEWSCQLLEPADLRLFARLAVFPAGCAVDGAEQVVGADIDGLQSLVDKSLLRHSDERFWMLETIREYAGELFARSSDADYVRARHVNWCIDFIDRSEHQLVTGRAEAVQDIEREFANIRSAFQWCIATGRISEALRLVRPRVFWQSVQTRAVEGRQWMDAVLARSHGVEPALRSRVLATAGDLLRVACAFDEATAVLQEALEIDATTRDLGALAATAYALGRVHLAAGRYEAGLEVSRQGLVAAQEIADAHSIGELTAQLAELTYRCGDTQTAAVLAADALGAARAGGDLHSEGDALRVLAMTTRDSDDLDAARDLVNESLVIMRSLSDGYCVSLLLAVLGEIELRNHDAESARVAFTQALEYQRSIAQWLLATDSLWGAGAAELAAGRPARAAVLLGAEAALRSSTGACLQVTSPERHAAVHGAIAERLADPQLAEARRRGADMTPDEMVRFALDASTPWAHSSASDNTSAADGTSAAEAPMGTSGVLRSEGEYWTVGFEGSLFRLRDAKGLHYLATLLRNPGREFHALDLVRVTEGNTAGPDRREPEPAASSGFDSVGPVLDAEAKAAYRVRLRELEIDLEEATSWSDSARAARLHEEMEFLTAELAGAFGLHGRDRVAASAAERARVNVTRAIRSILQRMAAHDPSLGHHLDAAVHTGTFCSYTPDPRLPRGGAWTS